MHAALAWCGDCALGMVHWIYHRSCWTEGNYCYLQDLYVDENVRETGLGRRLIEHVYQQAEQQDADRVIWLTREDNHTACQLYDRIAQRSGFIQY